ncbi:amino acid ABC transporter permease [Verticiella sediminum]|uniref:Amino acid ABC transporter permease n=1 Tax=Verticiella sediminum TaxID=1247510 RepID=A0A556B0W5_9BURK|nr:amino acid ABC transporter permease [Verticiella sediminum]TSH98802.1 amino acid ABC transporter permease [Verticiella sediminum]
MSFDFAPVLERLPYLMAGAWISLQLAFFSFALGMVIGVAGAGIRAFGPRPLSRLVNAYVVFFTNTPQLIQIFFIFFALPEFGILVSPYMAVLIGMTLNAGAYLTEIQRAGFNSVHRQELEAAETLGFSRVQTIRLVILPHIMRVLFPPLSNQYIIMVLGTSMAAVFGVEELTGRAFNINSETFRSIEVFSTAAVLYIVVTLFATLSLAYVGRRFFRARMRWF